MHTPIVGNQLSAIVCADCRGFNTLTAPLRTRLRTKPVENKRGLYIKFQSWANFHPHLMLYFEKQTVVNNRLEVSISKPSTYYLNCYSLLTHLVVFDISQKWSEKNGAWRG